MTGVTDSELNARGRCVPGYRGAYCKDVLPKIRRDGTYIVNMDNHTGPGTHWVLLRVGPHRNDFFDPFGVQPPLAVRAWTHGPIHYSVAEIQGPDSTDCGKFCFYMAREMGRGRPMASVITDFHAAPLLNDKIVESAWRAAC